MKSTSYKFVKHILVGILISAFISQASAEPGATPPLFKAYPTLQNKLGYVSLGTLPTPIQKLENLGTKVGCSNLYIKKDNLSGTLFGGNKVRKLEFLLGDALANNAKGVLTLGAAGSNHTCATAAYAQKCGLACICLHLPQEPTSYAQRNLLISMAHDAELHLYRQKGEREKAIYDRNKEFKKQTGSSLYFIPTGGSNEIGALGFVNAAFELKEQVTQGLLPEPDFIYVVLGSTGTAAGLILGARLAGLKSIIIPVSIEYDGFEGEHAMKLCNLIRLTSVVTHKIDTTFPEVEITPQEVTIDYRWIGDGYAKISPEACEAIKLLQETENIKLDGTYTGKAFASLLNAVRTMPEMNDKTILFWDSFCSGDFSDITKTVDYKKLPEAYHHYFECQLTNNDQGV